MHTTRLSSKGQMVIPKALRDALHWTTGLEVRVTHTGDGLLIRPQSAFAATELVQVSGLLKDRVAPRTDSEIAAALRQDLRRRWRDRR